MDSWPSLPTSLAYTGVCLSAFILALSFIFSPVSWPRLLLPLCGGLIAYWAGKVYLDLGLIVTVVVWWRFMPPTLASPEVPPSQALWKRALVWLKNLAFFLICLFLVRELQVELDRVDINTTDSIARIRLMEAAAGLVGAGLFGLFAEAPWPDLTSKWSARFDAVTVLLFGGWLIYILRAPDPYDEYKDAVALLVILAQARVGRSLVTIIDQLRIESDGKGMGEFNTLKF